MDNLREVLKRVLLLLASRTTGWAAAGVALALWFMGEAALPFDVQRLII